MVYKKTFFFTQNQFFLPKHFFPKIPFFFITNFGKKFNQFRLLTIKE